MIKTNLKHNKQILKPLVGSSLFPTSKEVLTKRLTDLDTGIYLFQNDETSKQELKTITQKTAVKFKHSLKALKTIKKFELEVKNDKSKAYTSENNQNSSLDLGRTYNPESVIARNKIPGYSAMPYTPGLEDKNSLTIIKSEEKFLLSDYVHSINPLDKGIVKSQNIIYKFSNKKNRFTPSPMNLTSILESSFLNMSCLISRPVFKTTPKKVVIELFYLLDRKNNKLFKELNFNKLNLLCANLSKKLKKAVVLDLVRLHYPFLDSTILAKVLGNVSNVYRTPFIFIMDKVLKNGQIQNPNKTIAVEPKFISMPSFITGINIRLAGRLFSQKVIPRYTIKKAQEGSLTRASADLVFKSRSTHINKRGTYSITITMGHSFF